MMGVVEVDLVAVGSDRIELEKLVKQFGFDRERYTQNTAPFVHYHSEERKAEKQKKRICRE